MPVKSEPRQLSYAEAPCVRPGDGGWRRMQDPPLLFNIDLGLWINGQGELERILDLGAEVAHRREPGTELCV